MGVFADKRLSVDLMYAAKPICYSILVFSLVLVLVAYRKAAGINEKLYWVGVVTSLNYHLLLFMNVVILADFFVIPKIVSG